MAGSSKTKWAQLRVGIMAVAALLVLTFLIFLMSGTRNLFASRSDVYTYLDDSAAIAVASPVRLNGILVGKVAKVELSGSAEPNRVVRVILEIDDQFMNAIPDDSSAVIAQETLLSSRYVNIKKGKSTKAITAGAEIKSGETPEIADLLQQGYSALGSMDAILKKLDGVLDSVTVGKGTIGKLLVDEQLYNKALSIADDARGLVANLNTLINNKSGTLGRLVYEDELYQEVRGSVGKINTMLDNLNAGQGTAGALLKDREIYDELRNTIGDVRMLLAGLNRGEGTAGKLLKSDELHDQIKNSLARMDSILDKVNSGQGTIGQLLVNPQLYESIDGTTREMRGLLQDFRSNPKKFLRIKLAIF